MTLAALAAPGLVDRGVAAVAGHDGDAVVALAPVGQATVADHFGSVGGLLAAALQLTLGLTGAGVDQIAERAGRLGP